MPNIDGDNRSYIVALQQHQTDVEDVIRQGTTVVRSVSQFRSLDASLRQESCKEVVQVVVFPSTINQQSLQEYMQTILQMPKVIHSDALAVFLTVVDNSTEEHSTLQCVQYLLPGIQSPTYEPIPRFGSYEQTIDTILPGWWLVWYLQSDAIVDFEVVATGTDGVQELVHQETCEQDCCFGSYRVLSEPTRAVLKVRGRAIFFTGASKVFVDSAAIPHEAFVAACTAANDANAAAEKRRHAPLLSLILDSDQVNVCIHVWKDENKQAVSEELTETPMLYHVDQLTTLSDQVVSSEQQANELTSARDDLRKELANSQTLVKKMKQNLEMAASERRVWNVVRSELQSELSRLSREVETERNDKTRAVADLQEARQELREISGQLRLVELQGNTSSNTNWTKSQEEELKQARRKLESDLQTEKSRSEKLQRKLNWDRCLGSRYRII